METREERNARQRNGRNGLVLVEPGVLIVEEEQYPLPDVPAPVLVAETPKGLLPTIRKVISQFIGRKK